MREFEMGFSSDLFQVYNVFFFTLECYEQAQPWNTKALHKYFSVDGQRGRKNYKTKGRRAAFLVQTSSTDAK